MNENYLKIETNIDIIVGLLNQNPNIPDETKKIIIDRLNDISNVSYEMS